MKRDNSGRKPTLLLKSTYTQNFDIENRLASVTVNSQTTTFVYDGDGNLVRKIKPDGTSAVYIGGVYEVELNTGGSVTKKTSYYGAAMRVEVVGVSNTLYYVLRDHLGSASVTLDASGNVVANGEQRYYPFGESRIAGASLPTDRLYTGQRDTGLGLYHYGARFYSSALGRFISADSIVPNWTNPQSLNRYAYVLNSPMRYTDPTGHVACVGGNWDDGPQCFTTDKYGKTVNTKQQKYIDTLIRYYDPSGGPYHNSNWDHLPESVKETLSNGSGEDTTTYYKVPYSGQVTDAGGGYYDDDRGRVHVYRFSADRAYNLQRDLVHANVPGTAFDIFTSEIISDTMDNSIEITTKNIPIIGMAFGAIDSVQSSTVIAIYDQIWELNKDKKTGAFQSLAVVLIERPCQPNGAGGCATNFSAVAFVIDSKGNVSDAVSFSFVSWGKIKGVLDNGLTSGDGG